ncbi:MAG: mannitol dehydrogenase [Firmicutes bacterium]|nr:mannitol dehydrogenase [Bacillota bacterium]
MSNDKKTAVMYGAGNIGRGFIGQLFHDSGYEAVFIDVNLEVVGTLNEWHGYTQLLIDEDAVEQREITDVRAVDGRDVEAVAREIAACAVMAVSVGAAILPRIAPLLAAGLTLREAPLNILVCENLAHGPLILRGYVAEHLSDASILNRVGFVGATIGRMVPVMPTEQRAADPTCIAVERFCTLPLDADAVVQPFPELKNAILCSPFAFQEGKKLYIHNMGHALCAYFGFLRGYTYIWQAVGDPEIYGQARTAMLACAEALARKYGEDRAALTSYVDDLLARFGNKGLGDTVARVGGDPLRKLAPGDRLMGAVDLCREQGTNYSPILAGIAAALRFDAPGDPSAETMRERLEEQGTYGFLEVVCGMGETDAARFEGIAF